MSKTSTSFINPNLYNAYYSLFNKVLTSYHHVFEETLRLKESRKTLTYNPSLKYYLKPNIPLSEDTARFFDAQVNEHSIKEDIALFNIVDFTIDGLYEKIKELQEYKHCVQVMDSDQIINKQVGKSLQLSLLGSIQQMYHWKYISHFLKYMVFQRLDNHKLIDALNNYYSDLETFFYQDQIEVIDISPIHYFQIATFNPRVGIMPIPIKCSINLSDNLRILPVTHENKIRFWNKFAISHIDESFEGINYFLEYRYKIDKGFEGTQDQQITIHVDHYFTTVVTLFRLMGVTCGIYDKTTATRLDLPIHHIPLNLFVSALGVAYSFHSLIVISNVIPNNDDMVVQFRKLWDKYGDLLVKNVTNNTRFEGDPFANLKVSINRFNDAFERKDGTDAFIDNIVALEALFSKKDDKYTRDKTERLSKRLAVFLEADPKKREVLLCDMIELYQQRNEIIHGGYTERYNIVTTRDYLIRSYLKYFDFLKHDNFCHTELIRLLDLDGKEITKTYDECKKEIESKYESMKAANG
jgi:hypothetical protein